MKSFYNVLKGKEKQFSITALVCPHSGSFFVVGDKNSLEGKTGLSRALT